MVMDSGAGVGAEDTLVVLKQSEPVCELVTGGVDEEEEGCKPEV